MKTHWVKYKKKRKYVKSFFYSFFIFYSLVFQAQFSNKNCFEFVLEPKEKKDILDFLVLGAYFAESKKKLLKPIFWCFSSCIIFLIKIFNIFLYFKKDHY